MMEPGSRRKDSPAVYEIDWSRPDAQDVMAFVNKEYEEGKRSRYRWEAQAAEQLAYARGNQHVRWSTESNSLEPETDILLEDRFPITKNIIRPFLFSWISMIVSRPITWSARPRTSNDADLLAARLQTRLLQHAWRSEEVMKRMVDGLWLMYCTGIAFIKVTWNAYGGSRRAIRPSDVGERDEAGLRQWVARRTRERPGDVHIEDGAFILPEGDLDIDFVSGFEITEPASAKSLSEASWIIHSRFVPVEILRARYPDKTSQIHPASSEDVNRFRLYERFQLHKDYTGREGSDEGDADVSLVHELWRPRSHGLPNGYFGVFTSDAVLHSGPNPYTHGMLPFVDMREGPDPQFFRPGCTVRDLMGIQRAANRIRSQAHGHFHRTVDPTILYEPAAGLGEDAFVAYGPKKIKCNDINRIKAWVPERPPEYMFSLIDMDDRDMEDVGRLHRASLGSADFAKQSGAHARTMQLADSQSHMLTRIFVEDAMQRAGQQCIMLLSQYVTNRRRTPTRGAYNEPEILEWMGKDLIPESSANGQHTPDIKVSLSPDDNTGETMQRIEVLTKAGFLSPDNPDDRIRVMRWMGDDTSDKDDEGAQHRANAAEEHQMMLAGQSPVVSDGDDDLIHIHEHRMFQTRDQFKSASASDPGIRQRIESHILAHEYNFASKRVRPMMIAEAVKAQMANRYAVMIGGQQGAPPAGGQGGAPTPPAPPTGVPSGASSAAADGMSGRTKLMNGRLT